MCRYNRPRDQQIFPNSFFIANLGRSVAHNALLSQSSGRGRACQKKALIDSIDGITNAQIIRLLATSSSHVITRRVSVVLNFTHGEAIAYEAFILTVRDNVFKDDNKCRKYALKWDVSR